MMDKLIEALDAELRSQSEGNHYAVTQRGKFEFRGLDGEVDLHAIIRAILTALKEPSEAMLAAGEKLHPMGLEENSMRKYLCAMLDEAMK